MRRSIWIGAGVIVTLVLAVPLWLVLDDGGGRRTAALTEPTGPGDIGRLTITGVNGGAPIAIRAFSFTVSDPGVNVGVSDLAIVKAVDSLSPLIYKMLFQQPRDPADTTTAKLDLLSGGKPYLTYELKGVYLDRWTTGKNDTFIFHHGLPEAKTPAGAEAPLGPAAGIVGEMDILSLGGKSIPLLGFDAGSASVRPPQPGDPPNTPNHEPSGLQLVKGLDALSGPLVNAALHTDGQLGTINIRLIAPGTTTPYAVYAFKQTKIASLDQSAAVGSVGTQELVLSYKDFEMKIGGNGATAHASE